MAGTIQTLMLAPPSPHTPRLLFRHWAPSPPAVRPRSCSNPSLSFNHSCSVRVPTIIRACKSSNQDGGNGSEAARSSDSAKEAGWGKPLLSFVGNNFLPLALMGGVVLGLANPSLGCLADRYKLSKFSTFAIFIISGMTLRNGDIGAAAEAWPVGVLGLFSILVFTPCFSRAIVQIHLQPQEFVSGLAIFCCMPTTLSSGVALTQLAGGNSALALAMTVISSLLGILMVPWIQVSRSRSLLLMVKPAVFLVAVGMGIILHLVLLAFNAISINSLAALSGGDHSVFSKKENATAFLLVASQKTLPVLVAVVEQLGGAFGESGLLVLPCVAAHLVQIIIDSVLVNGWLRKDAAPKTAR
ncbi:unnamed protein product [Linum tenue]|uniref:Sodium/metabolite cotransporter BASS4, chloroplastic n=1 Tax=Linum tenue TaxID=586396 RepID=A0AAV0M7Z6_9ROSI|nr:unnamed protein product [Linum tenue]